MPNLTYQLSKAEDGLSYLVIFDTTSKPHLVNSTHPRWDAIREGVFNNDESILDLIDVGSAVARTILSDRVSYTHNALFFDGDEIAGEVVDHILRLIKEEGVDATTPLVKFLDKVNQNPSENSRRQLYSFLKKHDFSITPDGDFIGYKGVYRGDDEDGIFLSVHAGPAIVNGVPHEAGQVPQKFGDVVEMPRSSVADNPAEACSTGLHVSNWRYAAAFTTIRLAVEVNPRDVVSVPNDSNNEKIRCCRYKILGVAAAPFDAALVDMVKTASDPEICTEEDWLVIQEDWAEECVEECGCYANFVDFVETCFSLVLRDRSYSGEKRTDWIYG